MGAPGHVERDREDNCALGGRGGGDVVAVCVSRLLDLAMVEAFGRPRAEFWFRARIELLGPETLKLDDATRITLTGHHGRWVAATVVAVIAT